MGFRSVWGSKKLPGLVLMIRNQNWAFLNIQQVKAKPKMNKLIRKVDMEYDPEQIELLIQKVASTLGTRLEGLFHQQKNIQLAFNSSKFSILEKYF